MIDIYFKKLDPDARIPTQAHPDEDAGWDLFALEDTRINRTTGTYPELTWIRTGIAIAIPTGYYARIVGRSSAASRGFHVVEGVIDSGYRGEQMVRVTPIWTPSEGITWPWVINAGTSFAQLIVQRVENVRWFDVAEYGGELPGSLRGEKGYGSSGA